MEDEEFEGEDMWGIIIAIILFFVLYHPKYEGKTAEEWAQDAQQYAAEADEFEQQYNELKNCVENESRSDQPASSVERNCL